MLNVYLILLSLIYLVKIRLPGLFCYELLIKMNRYKLLQKYTFEICTLFKIMNICYKYNSWSLFTSDRKVDTWFRTGLLLSFDKVFIFIVNLYKYQNVFKSILANNVSWLGKTILMPNYWPSPSGLRWMSLVRNEIQNMVLLSTFCLLLTWFLFWISS